MHFWAGDVAEQRFLAQEMQEIVEEMTDTDTSTRFESPVN